MQHSYTRIVVILVESAALVSVGALGVSILEVIGYVHPYNLNTQAGRFFSQMLRYLMYVQGPLIVRISSFSLLWTA